VSSRKVGTKEFAEAVIANLGKMPSVKTVFIKVMQRLSYLVMLEKKPLKKHWPVSIYLYTGEELIPKPWLRRLRPEQK
jgi:hypothetical protein